MQGVIEGTAAFSPCGLHRHRLDRWWSDAPRALVCAANPSRADAARQDPTNCRLRALLRDRPGIGGYTLVNAEDRIAPDPAELRRWLAGLDPAAREAGREANLARIRALAAAAPLIIVAWGLLLEDGAHRDRVVAALSGDGARDLHALGLTAEGAPIHPLARGRHRVPLGAPLVVWRAARR
ncbi:DUF1643 domain-containing protein [Methylobacterium sp. JK268]